MDQVTIKIYTYIHLYIYMAKEFTLVWWIEDDTVGIMPLLAVTKESRPYAGAVVDMRWSGNKP